MSWGESGVQGLCERSKAGREVQQSDEHDVDQLGLFGHCHEEDGPHCLWWWTPHTKKGAVMVSIRVDIFCHRSTSLQGTCLTQCTRWRVKSQDWTGKYWIHKKTEYNQNVKGKGSPTWRRSLDNSWTTTSLSLQREVRIPNLFTDNYLIFRTSMLPQKVQRPGRQRRVASD